MMLAVAVDAGQTHTECIVVNEAGASVAEGSGGPSYHQDGSMIVPASFDAALAALDAVDGAVGAVLVGATGGQIPGRLAAIDAYMRTRFPNAAMWVIPDGEFMLLSYVGDGAGGILIAGTGSVAIGSFEGRRATVGGHGYLFGDEGAGSWIVLQYVRRALHAADRGIGPTGGVRSVCAHFGVADVRQVPGAIYARGAVDVNGIAQAAPLIVRAADEGDALAQALMGETSAELAALVGRLVQRLELPTGTVFPLYLVGGIWQAHGILLPDFEAMLPRSVGWTLTVADGSPTLAAARYARRWLLV